MNDFKDRLHLLFLHAFAELQSQRANKSKRVKIFENAKTGCGNSALVWHSKLFRICSDDVITEIVGEINVQSHQTVDHRKKYQFSQDNDLK